MRPAPGEVLHFSEDPTIATFVPHVASTAQQPEAYVWAVDHDHAPSYWFPRDCPRGMAWMGPGTTAADRERILGPGGGVRVHAIEHRWLRAMVDVRLYAYRLPASMFRPFGDPPVAQVAEERVEPLARPELVGDLIELHRQAGIQLRLVPSLRAFWAAVVGSTLEFSGIRLRNANALLDDGAGPGL